MHKEGKYRTSGAGDDEFRSVVPDYTDPDGSDRECTDQWGKASDATLWNPEILNEDGRSDEN